MPESAEIPFEQPEPAKLDTHKDWEPGSDIRNISADDGGNPAETQPDKSDPSIDSVESENLLQKEQLPEFEPGGGRKPSWNSPPLDPSTVPSSPTDQTSDNQAIVADPAVLSDEQFKAMKAQSEIERDQKLAQLRERIQQFKDRRR